MALLLMILLHPKSGLYSELKAKQDPTALYKENLLPYISWLLKLRLIIQKVFILLHLPARIGFHYLKYKQLPHSLQWVWYLKIKGHYVKGYVIMPFFLAGVLTGRSWINIILRIICPAAFKYSGERKSYQSFNEVYFWTSVIKIGNICLGVMKWKWL